MKKQDMMNLIKVISFLLIVVVLLQYISLVFRPKQNNSYAKYEGEIKHLDTFYEEPKDSLDVIFLGSSHIFSAISPLEMWNEYGIVGYDCTSSSQCAYKSYHYLQEILKYQSPKVVVFDLFSLFIDESIDEVSNRSALNYMKFSRNFLQTTYHSLNKDINETMMSYIFQILRYHSRWEELTAKDFDIKVTRDIARGYDMRYGTKRTVEFSRDDFPFLTEEPTDQAVDIVENAAAYIQDMVDLCENKGVQMLFIKTPVSGYTYETGNAMQKFADECGVPLIDYNLRWDELDLDYTTDFLDIVHLNYNGAKKFSLCLGKTLAEDFGLKDHRGEEEYECLNEFYREYVRGLGAIELQNCEELSSYIRLLTDSDHTVMYCGNVSDLDQEVKDVLGILPGDSETEIQYGAVDLENPDNSIHESGSGTMRYDILDGVGCEISAADNYRIRFGGENIIDSESGFCMVVYDKKLKLAADCVKLQANEMIRG